jgi:methylmalonyl-CoA mutase
MARYTAKNTIRFVTAASLFDGHDAAINMYRRLLQAAGVEVIHLGHNRSVQEVVTAAIEEDVQGIAVSSYQGGHMEYFKYMYDLLQENGAGHIQIFGGGGGVIVDAEIKELEAYGIKKIFSPEDGRHMGLDGIIDLIVEATDCDLTTLQADNSHNAFAAVARDLTMVENGLKVETLKTSKKKIPVLGITGTGGAGKSSLIDELLNRFHLHYPDRKIAILALDPSRRKTGGALLGDRIRMNAAAYGSIYLRSMATRQAHLAINQQINPSLDVLKSHDFDLIIVETSGIGQGDSEIADVADVSMYVMTQEYGASSQLEKIDMLDFADVVAINKFERRGSEDAFRDVKKQYRRNHQIPFETPDEDLPVYGTIATQYNDPGVNALFATLVAKVNSVTETFSADHLQQGSQTSTLKSRIIPGERITYLGKITEKVRDYHRDTAEIVDKVKLREAYRVVAANEKDETLKTSIEAINKAIPEAVHQQIAEYESLAAQYHSGEFSYQVRQKTFKVPTKVESLSHSLVPRVALPRYSNRADLIRYLRSENLPGFFPYTAGVFPFKRSDELPTRQFAGEGTPERTNKRFHYLAKDSEAKRLSVAFDSVTLYGEDPALRPDIFGKVGESGVSICTIEDMAQLFAGFDLCHPSTSVSMTINGPAPMILAMFMNTAINQQLAQFRDREKREPTESEAAEIKAVTLHHVRGTVQADILKEDQAQNTCIFNTEIALRMMGDIQQYFIEHQVRNYYSVSISGYHIAEAGANPITQLALTLANGFTYVEYYLSRGMKIDDFAPNLSFFFSNGLDPEYTVIGRVARRIWAIAMRDVYGANERSQKLKYHIQTSGRSLHAQEVDFNDIRTTLQALIAVMDNCNSLHTNAYDEAITTPTQESVRRAMAIQLIVNREFGWSKNENPLQGSFIIEEMTDLVEEAVLTIFDEMNHRGGVLGAMETQYQRMRIQEESLHYEMQKHSGELPIVGVNTFINESGDEQVFSGELTRATQAEKQGQLDRLRDFQQRNAKEAEEALKKLKQVALEGGNIFEELMETVKVASLGQISQAIYEAGGQYRRNL